MGDCFISHATADKDFVEPFVKMLERNGLEVFMAPFSIEAGTDWSDAVRNALSDSKCILFFASERACASAYVMQEVGGALFGDKRVIPIVWDMPPENLPGFANKMQALDLRADTADTLSQKAVELSRSMRGGPSLMVALIGGIVGAWVGMAVLQVFGANVRKDFDNRMPCRVDMSTARPDRSAKHDG